MSETIEQILLTRGAAVKKISGSSMWPTLKEDDFATIVATDAYKRGDIVLYKRGDAYVLHRLIGVGDPCVLRGDNTIAKEFVPRSEILGVLSAVVSDGDSHGIGSAYFFFRRLYAVITFPFRLVLARFAAKRKNKDKNK